MKITALEEYGLRCLVQLARHYDGAERGLSIRELAELEGLSIEYVSKITAILRKQGLILSTRGVKGGYRLHEKPEAMKLSEISTALSEELFDSGFCLAHTGTEKKCVHERNCAIRSVWQGVYQHIHEVLERMTLSDLLTTEKAAEDHVRRVILEVHSG